jgi:hypothetical protein
MNDGLPDLRTMAGMRPKWEMRPNGRGHFEVPIEETIKFQLMASIAGERMTPASRNIVKLIDLFIQEIREANDTATVRSVMRNQGGIQRLEELKDMIVKDYPTLK